VEHVVEAALARCRDDRQLARGLDRGRVLVLVGLDDRGRALVGDGHRADLDLYAAVVGVALDLLQCRAGHAGGDPFQVGEHREGPVGVDGDGEGVTELHGGTSWSQPAARVRRA
jgi:hypothetical protein